MIIEIPDKRLEEFVNENFLYDEEDIYDEFIDEFKTEIMSAINERLDEKKSIFKIFAEEKLLEHSKYLLECIDKELIKALNTEYEIPKHKCKLLFDGTQKHYMIKNNTTENNNDVTFNMVVVNHKNKIKLSYDLDVDFDCDDRLSMINGSLLTSSYNIYQGAREISNCFSEISVEFYMSEDLSLAFGEKEFSKVLIEALNLKSKRGNLSRYKNMLEDFCKD